MTCTARSADDIAVCGVERPVPRMVSRYRPVLVGRDVDNHLPPILITVRLRLSSAVVAMDIEIVIIEVRCVGVGLCVLYFRKGTLDRIKGRCVEVLYLGQYPITVVPIVESSHIVVSKGRVETDIALHCPCVYRIQVLYVFLPELLIYGVRSCLFPNQVRDVEFLCPTEIPRAYYAVVRTYVPPETRKTVHSDGNPLVLVVGLTLCYKPARVVLVHLEHCAEIVCQPITGVSDRLSPVVEHKNADTVYSLV